ncbi:MAG: hypothetical protein HY650_13385 [Acidobacteria bacterium]|nr:hypothetical protein [Acidobacteriota bacterium]
MMLRRSLQIILAAWLLNGVAMAQQGETLTLVATLKAKPGKEGTIVDLVKKYDQPTFSKLMADGTVLAWGLDAAVLHHQGEPGMYLWWTIPNYAAQDKVVTALEETEKKMKADDEQRLADAKKNKQPAPRTTEQEIMESIDFDHHHDLLLRNLVSNVGAIPDGTLPYTWLSRFKVERGKGSDFRKLWDKYEKAIWDKLVADGVIFGYGLAAEDVNSMGSGLRWFWVIMRDHAVVDKVDAAFKTDRDKRSEEERAAISRQFREVTDNSADHDDLFRAVIHASK